MEKMIEKDRELFKILSEEPVLNQKGRRDLQRLYRYATQVDKVEPIHPTVLYKVLEKIEKEQARIKKGWRFWRPTEYRWRMYPAIVVDKQDAIETMEKYKPRG